MTANLRTPAPEALPQQLERAFGPGNVAHHAPLAPLTTFGVGGAAEWLVLVRNREEMRRLVEIAASTGTPLTVLGGGSNVLVSDGGVRGIVARMRGGAVVSDRSGRIRSDAGVTVNGLVRWTINRGVSGLEAWAGTPGTVGGAIAGNAHFQGRMIGEHVETVGLMTRGGEFLTLARDEMEFAYDDSRVRRTGEIVLWAAFRVGVGEPAALRATARSSLAYRKQTQPLDTPSAGCIFRNPDPAHDSLPADLPASAGALIDRAGLKGVGVGGAQVSATHGNFIVNTGGATARDIRALIELCKARVADRFGVRLREEIVYLGEF